MKLIVGLGNYPEKYRYTRHNIGFLTVEEYVKQHCSSSWHRNIFKPYKIAKTKNAIFMLPLTYMNNTGKAVADFVREVNLKDVLLICDDLDLDWLRLRLRLKGSSGGHKGLESVFKTLGTDKIARLRMGIDRPKDVDVVEYVLSEFSEKEKKLLPGYMKAAFATIDMWIQGVDPERIMSEVNRSEFVLNYTGGEDEQKI